MNDQDQSNIKITPIVSINVRENDEKKSKSSVNPDHTLILPTRNLVLFPGVALPIQLGRESSKMVAQTGREKGISIGIVCQHDPDTENPTVNDLYRYGVFARVIDIVDLPDGIKTAIVEGLGKFRVIGPSEIETSNNIIALKVRPVNETNGKTSQVEMDTMVERIYNITSKVLKSQPDRSMVMNIEQIKPGQDPKAFINNVSTHLPFEVSEKEDLLACSSMGKRAMKLLSLLVQVNDRLDIASEIMDRARMRMEGNKRTVFLQQQMDVIREELNGEEGDEIADLEYRSQHVGFPEEVMVQFNKELTKLRRYNPQSPDYSVQYTYLDTLLSIPWSDKTMETDNFKEAENILENDHYGLRKVKDRILEQLALIISNPEGHAPILCFVGPPGVGKTSLGASIASALGRKFERVSLGGLHDEAEIRGHRRTYIGAMPGRIIDAMKRAGSINPVLMLDELDKIGADFKGDPAAALLEVLDPEQNFKFHDNYIDVDYDLSKVIFIATANTLSTISKPLLDRIEVVELSGYTVEEKVEIARRHLIPKLLEKFNVAPKFIQLDDTALTTLIEQYTSESGVRQLEKRLEQVMRKQLLTSMRHPRKFTENIDTEAMKAMLGAPPYIRDRYEGNDYAGVVTGLAWTSVGGEILLAEASLAKGKGGVLTLTGNLGDVMKESATIALQWVKSNAEEIGVNSELFTKYDVHIHFPEGAIPKDGPSAGITIATALVSALRGTKVRASIAMTGEITLRGRVLPVGGIKEKILAARRAGIKEIILSEQNRMDIEEIEKEYLRGLRFHYVNTVREVIDYAVTDIPAVK